MNLDITKIAKKYNIKLTESDINNIRKIHKAHFMIIICNIVTEEEHNNPYIDVEELVNHFDKIYDIELPDILPHSNLEILLSNTELQAKAIWRREREDAHEVIEEITPTNFNGEQCPNCNSTEIVDRYKENILYCNECNTIINE